MADESKIAISHYAWDPRHELAGKPAAHHRLTAMLRAPSAEEKRTFSASAPMELSLIVEGPAIVVLWETALLWGDAPYSWHAQKIDAVPDTRDPGGHSVPLDCLLYDTRSMGKPAVGVRHAVPWAWMRELHAAIAAQSAQPFEQKAYDATIRKLAEETREALQARALARTRAGGR